MVKVCLRYEAFTGSDVGHGLVVALLVSVTVLMERMRLVWTL